ncbi:MAG TPA: hypothetical protein VFT75_02955 [Nocardioidaceae bacterium]|nr:hypothetical protein [Nocardioidaceae bacterium]
MPRRAAVPDLTNPPQGRDRCACAGQLTLDEVVEMEHVPGDPEFTAAYAAALATRVPARA